MDKEIRYFGYPAESTHTSRWLEVISEELISEYEVKVKRYSWLGSYREEVLSPIHALMNRIELNFREMNPEEAEAFILRNKLERL